jgi:hypothetical protein
MKFIILSEGLASAIAKYGEMAEEASWGDPTPTKKYTEFLAKHYDDILDVYEGTQDEVIMYDIMRDILKKFNKISKNLSKKDINHYESWNEVLDSVKEYNTRTDKRNPIKQIHPESKVIFENDEVIIIRVYSYKASEQYGSGKFCIASNEDTWDDYTEDGGKYFYLFKKNNVHRPCVIEMFKDDETGQIKFVGWTHLNKSVNAQEIFNDFGVDRDLFIKNYWIEDSFNQ